LISLFEILDQIFDLVIVDGSTTSGTFRRLLHRAADRVLLVTEPDPAAIYASFEKVTRIKQEISPDTTLHLVENQRSTSRGLSAALMIEEFERVAGIGASQWCSRRIPFSREIASWPGSGSTPFSLGSTKARKAFSTMAFQLSLVEETVGASEAWMSRSWKGVAAVLRAARKHIPKRQNREQKILPVEMRPRLEWLNSTQSEVDIVDRYITPPQPV